MKKIIIHIFLIFAILLSYAPIRYLWMKQDIRMIYDEKDFDADDDSDDDKIEVEKEIKDFFANVMEKLHFQAYQSYTHTSYFYLLKNYYVVKENLSPPPEML